MIACDCEIDIASANQSSIISDAANDTDITFHVLVSLLNIKALFTVCTEVLKRPALIVQAFNQILIEMIK